MYKMFSFSLDRLFKDGSSLESVLLFLRGNIFKGFLRSVMCTQWSLGSYIVWIQHIYKSSYDFSNQKSLILQMIVHTLFF